MERALLFPGCDFIASSDLKFFLLVICKSLRVFEAAYCLTYFAAAGS